MPEGPELHLASCFINRCCLGRVFTGKVIKSLVHKCDEVPFEADAYTISALSRGKEMQLVLSEIKNETESFKPMRILFRFGMSGTFEFTPVAELHKHSHLRFFTVDEPPMVLSHVDARRFGRWEIDADWSKDRGPDAMFDYPRFRSNVLSHLDKPAFQRPICETLLNQKYFNGVGNYLRAEILYRLAIPPFQKAYDVLKDLVEEVELKPGVTGRVLDDDVKVDILHLCHTVPLEVVKLGTSAEHKDAKAIVYGDIINTWLQCYYQTGMSNLVDHKKRTIWFQGPAGPMAPKVLKSRITTKKRTEVAESASDELSSTSKCFEQNPKKLTKAISRKRQAKNSSQIIKKEPRTPKKTKSEPRPGKKTPPTVKGFVKGTSQRKDTPSGTGYTTRSKHNVISNSLTQIKTPVKRRKKSKK